MLVATPQSYNSAEVGLLALQQQRYNHQHHDQQQQSLQIRLHRRLVHFIRPRNALSWLMRMGDAYA
jgi:hypothetical protein